MPDVPDDVYLGSHVSISGGIDQSPDRAREIGCTTAQVFVSSNRQWSVRDLDEGEDERFRDAHPVLSGRMHAHACYLINLAKKDEEKLQQGIDKLSKELSRCDRLGIPHLVLHPGSHLGEGEDEGIKRIQEALDRVHDRVGETDSMILLETMAGQGSVLPYTFEQLKTMRAGVEDPDRLGYCFDTCHVHAAGYDLSTESGYESTMEEMESVLELEDVKLLHLNDSQHEAGERKDRHEDIGEGTIGKEGFRCLMNDERWSDVPKVLETPVEDDWKEDYGRNMETLLGYLDDI
jgi:deoxyribonuclease-4